MKANETEDKERTESNGQIVRCGVCSGRTFSETGLPVSICGDCVKVAKIRRQQ